MAMKNPPDLGRIIKEDCLPELTLTAGAAAETLGVSPQTLELIMNGRSSIAPEIAIRYEKVFGSSAESWLRMQLASELAQPGSTPGCSATYVDERALILIRKKPGFRLHYLLSKPDVQPDIAPPLTPPSTARFRA